jgi:hypothetical protein
MTTRPALSGLFAVLLCAAAQAGDAARDFVGIYAPGPGNDAAGPVFKIVRKHGALQVYVQQDDDRCAWLPLDDDAGKPRLVHAATGSGKAPGASAAREAIVVDGWAEIARAPMSRNGQSIYQVRFVSGSGGWTEADAFRKQRIVAGCI